MKKHENPFRELGQRERQIVEAVVKLGEASVSQVLDEIPDPPTYTSVRTENVSREFSFLRRKRFRRIRRTQADLQYTLEFSMPPGVRSYPGLVVSFFPREPGETIDLGEKRVQGDFKAYEPVPQANEP